METAGFVDPPEPRLDSDGHLADAADWTRDWAEQTARRDGVELTDLHWWLIGFVRDHYLAYGMPPLMRVAIKAMREAGVAEAASSRTLYRLFPDRPIRQACRYAGVPAPESCI
ncbi:MAG: TusE/DsrC/DsvC family sulfur relay protein [Wenzhouxiangellaceae bacterium]